MITTLPSSERAIRAPACAVFILVCAALLCSGSILKAAELRVLPEGEVPPDIRLQPLKDLNGYFPFEPAPTVEEWELRAAELRRRIRVAMGLWPMPTKRPLNSVIHGRIDQGDYTVEKVYFQSFPNFYVTGNLYRPKNRTGRVPGILSPHGHWSNGRFYDNGRIRTEIAEGAERFENGGRSPLQARCVQLARMGAVVFHYDMVGYADSRQLSEALAHRFAKQRPDMNQEEDWGFFSPQAESRLQSIMGLQTFNSIRALDFLLSLPEVDPERIGVTGASGGGTQTFILCAIDSRPAAAFPAVMVSTAMQGGCTCENACLLRIGTGNVEFAALFAPKPMGLTAADDWTREMETKGFPELRQHYGLWGAGDQVMLKPLLHFGHNYNSVSRTAMYSWFNRALEMGWEEPILERDYPRLDADELTVWNQDHPQPAGGPEFERRLLEWWDADSQEQLREAQGSLESFRESYGGGIDILIGRSLAEVGAVEWDLRAKIDRGNYMEMGGLLQNPDRGEALPVVWLHPKDWNGQTVVWIDERGKAGLFAEGVKPRREVADLLEGGATVVGVDLLFQGEFLEEGRAVDTTRRVENPREAAAYTFGYNPSLFARRVHDVLTVIAFIQNHERPSRRIDLIGLGSAGPWVAAARAQAAGAIDRAVIDTGGFRFSKVKALHDPDFVPGGAKYGDLPGMLALGAPQKVWLAGEGSEAPPLVSQMYRSAGAAANLVVNNGSASAKRQEAIAWLLNQED